MIGFYCVVLFLWNFSDMVCVEYFEKNLEDENVEDNEEKILRKNLEDDNVDDENKKSKKPVLMHTFGIFLNNQYYEI